MPAACTICADPRLAEVNAALVVGEPVTVVSSRYFTLHARMAVQRHKDNHLPAALMKAHLAGQVTQADDLLAQLRRCFERINLLFDACDRWLRDPENPDRYDIGPRSDDVTVTYLEPGPNGTPIRKKAKLSRLLARLEDAKVDVDRGEIKTADPRELILRTAGQLSDQVTLLAKLLGELDDRPQVNVVLSPEWVVVRAQLLEALAPWPEAGIAVAGRLVALESPNGAANGHRG